MKNHGAPIPIPNPSLPFGFCQDCDFTCNQHDAVVYARAHGIMTGHRVWIDYFPGALFTAVPADEGFLEADGVGPPLGLFDEVDSE